MSGAEVEIHRAGRSVNDVAVRSAEVVLFLGVKEQTYATNKKELRS